MGYYLWKEEGHAPAKNWWHLMTFLWNATFLAKPSCMHLILVEIFPKAISERCGLNRQRRYIPLQFPDGEQDIYICRVFSNHHFKSLGPKTLRIRAVAAVARKRRPTIAPTLLDTTNRTARERRTPQNWANFGWVADWPQGDRQVGQFDLKFPCFSPRLFVLIPVAMCFGRHPSWNTVS